MVIISKGCSYLGLHEQGDAKVDSVSAHDVVDVESGLATGLGEVEGAADVVLLEDLAEGSLVLLGELDDLDLDLLLRVGLDELLDLGPGGVQLVAEGGDVVDDLGEPGLGDVAAKEETLARLGHAEVHGGLEGGPVGLDEVLAEAGDLTGGGHLDAEERIGAGETGPGELGDLGGKVVTLDSHEVGGLGNLLANEGLGGDVDEVGAEDLADEGEGSGGTEVALDDLELRLTTLGAVGLDDLHVEGAGDLPGLGDLLGNLLDALHGGAVEGGGGQNKGGVTRVNTGLLDVLGNGVDDELALGGNTVDVDLLGALDELGDDDGVVRGDAAGGLELVLEVLLASDHRHGGTRQDVAGADQDGVANLIGKLLGSLDRGELLPGGLVHADAVEDLGELLTVLGLVNVLGVGTQNLGPTCLLKSERDVLGQLAAHRHHHTRGVLELVDIHDSLKAEFIKVNLFSRIEIGAHGLWVILWRKRSADEWQRIKMQKERICEKRSEA